jgi:putative ABC transport system permease protein
VSRVEPKPPRGPRARMAWAARRLGTPDLPDDAETLFLELARSDGERRARSWYRRQARAAVWRALWASRGGWVSSRWDGFLRDVRHAARGLRRSPAFTSVAVATLALGIGANTAMFTVVNGVLLRPLPFEQSDRLVTLSHVRAELGSDAHAMSDLTFAELRTTPSHAFASLASFSSRQMTLTGLGDAERLGTAQASAGLMSTLGVAAALGRTFTAADEEAGGLHVVLLSDSFWRERFGGERSVLGRSIALDGVAYTVIGVMPPTFDFPHGAALWTPLPARPDPNIFALRPVIARLSRGTSIETARRELESTLARLPSTAREKPGTEITDVRPLVDLLVARARPSLWILSGAVSFVLLIACANVVNLLLIRASTRRHEIGVRVALGAGRARIVRQLVTESALIACLGGAAGVLLATWGVRVLLATAPAGRIPRGQDITVDWRVLGAAFGVSLVAGLLCGLYPALAGTRQDPREALTTSGRAVAGTQDGVRRVFVVAQLALAIVLSTGAGLLLKSFARMRAVDPGFRSSGVVTFGVNLSPGAFPDAADIRTFEADVVDRLGHVPGVETATMVNWIPLGGALISGDLHIEGVSAMPEGFVVDKLVTAPGYFSAMGIRLFAGRDFDSGDNPSSRPVTIVSRSVARRFWPPDGRGAIGHRLTEVAENPQPHDWRTIVGIVDDIAQQGLTRERDGAQYFPMAQTEDLVFIRNLTFVVRTARTASDLAPSLRAIAHEISPVVALRDIRSMEDAAAASIADPRFETRMLAIFAALALLLAAVGTYGVLAYDVAARTHELGVRVALGAVSGDVVRVVVGRTLALVVPGLLIGLIGALAVTRVLKKSLFEVTPTDPATLVAVSGVLLLVALIACVTPTRRAVRIDPMAALRSE